MASLKELIPYWVHPDISIRDSPKENSVRQSNSSAFPVAGRLCGTAQGFNPGFTRCRAIRPEKEGNRASCLEGFTQ
jgi:hypothetical protein